jgi:sugar O-acyltransferase (sialic acid O-acetyltransferase NeuD family)
VTWGYGILLRNREAKWKSWQSSIEVAGKAIGPAIQRPPPRTGGTLNQLIILGAGGYAQELLWIVDDLNSQSPSWDFLGFVDPKSAARKGQFHYDRPILGGWDDVPKQTEIYFACGIGSPASRATECAEAERRGYKPAALVHPSVIAARHVQIGEGTVVGAGCILAPYAVLGRHCSLNLGVTIGHNSSMGDYCVLSPGAQLLGAAKLGERVFLGANATVYQGRKVGAGSIVGANSFLLTHLGPGASVIGVPAVQFSHATATRN